MNVSIFELSTSLPLLIISLVVLGFLLYRFIKNNILRICIPSILAMFGLIFAILQITMFGKGYAAIPYVLIAWLFVAILIIAILIAVRQVVRDKW